MQGKEKLTFQLQLKMMSDWLIKGASEQKIAHASPLMDGQNRPYIPASTIKGNLRYHAKRLLAMTTIGKHYETFLFGESGAKQGNLYVEDCMLEGKPFASTVLRHRISINRRRKVVNDEALIVEEAAAKGLTLSGKMVCYVKEEEKAPVIALVSLALMQMNFLGSGKSVGRGYQTMDYKKDGRDDSYFAVIAEDREIPYEEWRQIVLPYIKGGQS